MARTILSNDLASEKSNNNELIYLAAIICDSLNELEPTLTAHMANDLRLRFMISVKNRWISRFWEISNQQYDKSE